MGAAIVGGVISGVLVLLGVVTAERLRRAGDRQLRLEQACTSLSLLLPAVAKALVEDPTGKSAWPEVKEVFAASTDVEALTRRRGRLRPQRRWADANRLVLDLIGRVHAADEANAWASFGSEETWGVLTALTRAVFGREATDHLAAVVAYYRENGPGATAFGLHVVTDRAQIAPNRHPTDP